MVGSSTFQQPGDVVLRDARDQEHGSVSWPAGARVKDRMHRARRGAGATARAWVAVGLAAALASACRSTASDVEPQASEADSMHASAQTGEPDPAAAIGPVQEGSPPATQDPPPPQPAPEPEQEPEQEGQPEQDPEEEQEGAEPEPTAPIEEELQGGPVPIGQAPPVIRGRTPEGGAGAAVTEQGLIPDPAKKVNGWLALQYWGRFAGSENDHDLFGSMALDFGDPAVDRISGYLYGRVAWDIDDFDGDDPDPFHSLQDTHDQQLTGDVFEAYVDINRLESLELVRAGRQQVYDTPETAWFDGVRLETKHRGETKFQLGVYGGLPVHLYESSSSGDVIFGSWLEGRPWKGGRWRLDWMHIEDERMLDEAENDLFSLGLWQAVGQRTNLQALFTRLEGENRDLKLSGTWFDQGKDLVVRGTYYGLLETQRDLVIEFDPYFEVLREYHPFHQVGFTASKGLGTHLLAELGADIRALMDSGDESDFNHEFQRYHLTLAHRGAFGREGLTLSLTGDLWEDDDLETRSWGADVTDALRKDLSWSAGTYYALYKDDLLADEEREDVRTWYLKLRKRQGREIAYQVGYEFEDTEFEEFQTLRLGVTWHF